MKRHPLCALFDPLPDEQLQAMAADIKQHGLRHPIITYQGMLLDGQNRLAACKIAGVPAREVEYKGTDPAAVVISENLRQRDHTASQRAMLEVQVRGWVPVGGNVSRGAPGAPVAAMAKESNTSERTIQQAKQVQANGSDELKAAVKSGEISVKKAAEVAKEPKKKQARAIKEAKAPKPKKEKAKPEDNGDDELANELIAADKEIRSLNDLVASLKKSDLAAEVVKWRENFTKLEARLQQCIATKAEAEKQAKYSTGLLAKIRKILKVEKNAEIIPALEAR